MTPQKREILKGTPAAPGLAHGNTIIFHQAELEVKEFKIDDVEEEIQRLGTAIEESLQEIDVMKEDLGKYSKNDETEIFEAHRMFLTDDALLDLAKDEIRQGINAEKAWMNAIEHFATMMEQIADETLSARAVDIRDVGRRVLSHLMDVNISGIILQKPAVIVAKDLAPSDTVSLDKKLVLGFCTAEGGPTSHTAILAKTFGLPAVVGLGEQILDVIEGTMVLVDGNKGEVVIAPDQEMLDTFTICEKEQIAEQKIAREKAQVQAVTADDNRVEVVANIGGVVDAPFGIQNGAEGVGLLRTEFIYLDRIDLPTEEEQIEVYTKVFCNYLNMPVVVRTLDIGGDKTIPYLHLPEELNPFLGWRGIRMLDGEKELFLKQFRALLQAGSRAKVDLHIMVPMVSCLAEVMDAKALLETAKDELRSENKPFPEDVKFGIMIEVPSAALLASRLAKEVDFFSIGTNDLTQYTLAVDRTNSKVSHLAHPLNPAVLHLIKKTIDGAHQEGKWVGLCGELAGDPLATPILLGLGLDEFSMAPTRVPVIKEVLRKLHKKDCVDLVEKVLCLSDAQQVTDISRSFLADLGLEY
jgi:phosphoenolpyruvate-protein phosphotransferase (PTS system enzyme I)